MINSKKILGIIPARGGSKGLKDKNIRPLCGKALVGWTIEQAANAKLIDRTILSTDSPEIADIARQFGADIPFMRPAELATDHATTIDVVKHALDVLGNISNDYYDYLMLLEPTSPLREASDLDHMIERLAVIENEFDAIVSVGEVADHPNIVKKIHGKKLLPFGNADILPKRRQDYENAYFPYGVGYLIKTDILIKELTFYCRRLSYYKIKRYQCFEIDDIYQFLAVESIMRYQWGLQ